MKKLFLLLALLGMVAVGCSKDEVDKGNDNKTEQPNENEGGNENDDDEKPVFEVDSDGNYNVEAEGGEVLLAVTTNLEYSVYIPKDARSWIFYEETRAVRSETVVLSVEPNSDTELRIATVELRDAEGETLEHFTVVQKPYGIIEDDEPEEEYPIFESDNEGNYSITAEGGEIVVTVATNIEYSVDIPKEAQSWISLADTRAVRLEKLVFTIAANEATEERRAVVKLIGGDKSELQSITFIQQGKSTEIEIPDDTTETIKFSDADTKLICISHWDTNDDGELSYEEAAVVTDLGTALKGSSIMAFTELKYFTGLSGITDNAFDGCVSLVKITLPEQITSIGNSAFNGCNNLKNIDIPDSVTTIGERAFEYCSSLTSVTIPDSVTTIGDYAFRYCSCLTSVTIPDSVTTIGWAAFSSCDSLTSVTIGNSVTTIGSYAFYNCDSLTSVTIPVSVTTIGESAFDDCRSLTSVFCKATTPPSLGEKVFKYYIGSGLYYKIGCDIYVPTESVEAYKSAEGWSEYASDIEGYYF